MTRKKWIVIAGVLILLYLIFKGGGRSGGEAKWVDFGNGLVNLNRVTLIIPQNNAEVAIKFDDFTMTLQRDPEISQKIGDLNAKGKVMEAMKLLEESNKKILGDNLGQITDFIKSNRTYFKMK